MSGVGPGGDVATRLSALEERLGAYRTQGCVLEPQAVETICGVLRDCAEDAARMRAAVALPLLGRVA